MPRQVELRAVLDPSGEERRAGPAAHGGVRPAVAVGVLVELEQPTRLLRLGQDVESAVLRDADPRLMTQPVLIIFSDLDVVSRPVLEL